MEFNDINVPPGFQPPPPPSPTVTHPSMDEIMVRMQALQDQADVRHAQQAAEAEARSTAAINALQA
jgi:hypothetical protein